MTTIGKKYAVRMKDSSMPRLLDARTRSVLNALSDLSKLAPMVAILRYPRIPKSGS